jgi:TPR repeat protein
MFVDFHAGANGSANIRSAPLSSAEYYERGLTCSCRGEVIDLVEAHKWFNLAAMGGDSRAAAARQGVALELTPREIAEAQRRARSFLNASRASLH